MSVRSIRKNISKNENMEDKINRIREHAFKSGHEAGFKLGLKTMGEIIFYMTAVELVASEQVIKSLIAEAHAEQISAAERLDCLTNVNDINEMREDMANFRVNVIEKLQSKMIEIDREKKTFAGITDFTWRH